MNNDYDLILRLQTGSLEALGLLYDRHYRMVYRTALGITCDSEAAADLLQDVFLRLHRFSDHIDPERPLEPWLYRMTTNLSYSWVKRTNRWLRPVEEVTEWLTTARRSLSRDAEEFDEDWQSVSQAISSLPVGQRVVIVLYYMNSLSLQEIAEILTVPTGTVKSRLYYGRETLKKKLGISAGEKLSDLGCEFT
jgi:RNA polymerase sigma-70 factor (ECF subfamily)